MMMHGLANPKFTTRNVAGGISFSESSVYFTRKQDFTAPNSQSVRNRKFDTCFKEHDDKTLHQPTQFSALEKQYVQNVCINAMKI
jgi:hypothetical protein